MEIEHIPIEAVRAYLLGALSDKDAATIEVQYFVNRSSLLQMQAAERVLIGNYLDGLLSAEEKAQFERRYFESPALTRIVERVKRERAASAAHHSTGYRLAWSGVALCAIVAVFFAVRSRRTDTPAAIDGAPSASPLAAVTLRLTPGVKMGAGDGKAARLDLPPARVPVTLIAELPGVTSTVECGARLSLVRQDGNWNVIWSAKPSPTTRGNGGEEANVPLAPSLLRPGDYVLELTAPDGRVRETYLFRVSPPQ